MKCYLAVCLFILGSFAPAWAVDYDRIPRKIGKEPKYTSPTPGYALLLFGREAKVRVWIALDGDRLFLDRNADGDLTGKDKLFAKAAECKNIDIADPDGKTRYRITGISLYRDEKPARTGLIISVDITGPVQYKQYCDVEITPLPAKVMLAHFHGPLTAGPRTLFWKVPEGVALHTEGTPSELHSHIGTMSARHGCWVVVRSHDKESSAFPDGVFPTVEVEFPAKAVGGLPIKKKYTLDKFC